MNKDEAFINFIKTCELFNNEKLFFNFGIVEQGARQFITQSDDALIDKECIDGSKRKRYTMYLDTFKSTSYIPIVDDKLTVDENFEEFNEVQEILDWINDQDSIRNYPDFGTDIVIDKMQTTTNKPELVTVNRTLEPAVAIYRISVRIDYVDLSNTIC